MFELAIYVTLYGVPLQLLNLLHIDVLCALYLEPFHSQEKSATGKDPASFCSLGMW